MARMGDRKRLAKLATVEDVDTKLVGQVLSVSDEDQKHNVAQNQRQRGARKSLAVVDDVPSSRKLLSQRTREALFHVEDVVGEDESSAAVDEEFEAVMARMGNRMRLATASGRQ